MPASPHQVQFDTSEAMAMLEFCVDLDSQDDRMEPDHRHIYDVNSKYTVDWAKVWDSRTNFSSSPNPKLNGFPPFDSAWTLWKNSKPGANGEAVFALAFRGTVFSNKYSAAEDALATTVAAQYGIELPRHSYLPITFAKLPRAEVHEGFAYALFGQLFDKKYGVLAKIGTNTIPRGSTLIITGHSQGAALATLAHAFFYYAKEDARFGMAAMNLNLRSCVFAQPKPGNVQFSMDFARISGTNSLVFNNTLDPVPMLPPTHLFAAEAFEDVKSRQSIFKFLRGINNCANSIKRIVSRWFQNKLASKIAAVQKKDHDSFVFPDELKEMSKRSTHPGVSQSYMPAGIVMPLVGNPDGGFYHHCPQDNSDDFIQHHATTYRWLMETLYHLPLTTEQSINVN